jgi:hypothetical protein
MALITGNRRLKYTTTGLTSNGITFITRFAKMASQIKNSKQDMNSSYLSSIQNAIFIIYLTTHNP